MSWRDRKGRKEAAVAWVVREGLSWEVTFDLKKEEPPHEDSVEKCSKQREKKVQEPCEENECVC